MRTTRTARSRPMTRVARGGAALSATLALVLAGCGTEETDPGDGPADDPAATTPEEDPPVSEDPTTPPDDETTVPEEPTETAPDDGGETTAPDDGTEEPPAAEPPDEGEEVDPGEATQRPDVRAAIEDAAERSGVDAADITVVSFGGVTWRDGSIGCPQPGQAYTMALVPGSRLVLDVGGEEQAYHAGGQQPLEYCANPAEPAPGTTS